MPESNASKSGRQRIVEMARSEDRCILALARRVCGYQGLEMVGTATRVADTLQLWDSRIPSEQLNNNCMFLSARQYLLAIEFINHFL